MTKRNIQKITQTLKKTVSGRVNVEKTRYASTTGSAVSLVIFIPANVLRRAGIQESILTAVNSVSFIPFTVVAK